MKTTQPSRTALVAASLLCAAGLAACGGGGSEDPDANPPDPDPDAAFEPDAGPTCGTAGDIGVQDIDAVFDGVIVFTAPGGTGPDGGDLTYQFEFFDGLATELTGTHSLSAGIEDNYATCALCVRAFSYDAAGGLVRQYFQAGGSITLTDNPVTTGVMDGTVTGLVLVEVTIADDYTSTPVDGGACLADPDVTLDADSVPNDWTCALNAYNDGVTCDCTCGAVDPDCGIDNAPVNGCTGTQICPADVCIDLCDSLATPPVGCTTGACGFQTATQDICYTDPALVDPAIVGGTCAADRFLCAVVNTVATGLCDTFIGGDNVCRHTCDATADCTGTEICTPIGNIAPKGICIAPPTNDTCQTATPLVLGTPASGSTVHGVSNYNAGLEGATCTGFAQPGADTAYLLALTAGQAVTVTLSGVSASFDPAIAIVGPGAPTVCDANPIVCLAGADAGVSSDGETFNFTATDPGNYYVLVDTFSTSGVGSYTLTVTAQ